MRLFFRRFTALVLMLIMILNILPLNLFAAYLNFGKLPDRYNLLPAAAVPDNKTSAAGFSDIAGHWAAPAIGTWSSLGILKGYGGLFRPDDALTRAELTAVLARIIGFSGTGSNPFTDVSADKWYYDAVSKLAAAGILVGFGGLARPETKITREEAAVMIVRAFGIPETGAYVRPFKDKNRISSWAADSVRRLQTAGCLSGRPDGTFDPQSFMTRAEFIALIDNILRIFKDLREKFHDILDGLRPARNVTVTFNANGGTFPGSGSETSPVTIPSGQALGNMPVPYKENMIFAGWFTDDGTFLNEVTADTPITSNMTLYACYQFIVTFHPNGGSDISPVNISSGQKLANMPVPYKENMIFAGWFTDDGTFLNEVTADTPVTSNMDLFACYRNAAVLNEKDEQDYASISDAAPDYSVTVLSTESMTSGEVKDSILVELKSGDEDDFNGISVTAGGSGSFTVAAAEGFTPGCSYSLILTDDALTFEGKGNRVRTFNITIAAPDPVLNLRLNSGVKMIPAIDISDITQNGEPVDSIFAPLYDMSGEPVEEIYGTFTYNGSRELSLGDNLAIYDATAPDERMAGVDYSDDNVAYVTVTGIDSTAISYSNARADDVLFTPDILPVNIGADTDGDENNLSITVLIGNLTYSGEDFAEMGLDSSTAIDVGDFLAFYEGTLPDDAAVTAYAKITHVMSDEEVYVITYIPVTEKDLHDSMDMASSRTLTYDQLSENTDIALLENEVEQQVTASGFASKAADFLMNLAAMAEDTRNQIVNELGIKDYRMTGNAAPVLLAEEDGEVSGAAETSPTITVDVTINRDLDHFDTDSGLNCDVTVTCSIDLSEDVNITITGTFEQEIGVDFDISSEAVWKVWGIFPYIADYKIIASLDVYSYTGLSLNASITSGSQPDLNIQEEIDKLKETSDNSVTPEKKSDAVREFYEIYQEMLSLNHDYIDLINVPLISVSGWVDPLYIIAFSFKTDFVVSVDVALSMGAEFGYVKATRYSVTLKLFSGTATTSQTDLVDNDYGFTVYIMGTIGLRAGLRLTVEVGLFSTNLDSIGFTAEVGAYWRIWGFAYYQLSHHDGLTERHSAGACYMELGVYLEVNFIAQLGNEAFSYVATLYEKEWPLLTIGDRYYVFEFNYELDDSTDDIALKFIDFYKLPATTFKMYHMDFYTGLISEKVYPAENFDLKITENNTYNGFVAISNGDILVNQPSSVVHKLSAKLSVTWKERPLSFTSAPLIRTFNLAWDDLDDSYYIRFEPNGGSCIPMIVAEYNAQITLPAPVLPGYVFQGWYRDESFADNTLYANKDNLTINMRTDNPTVYAKWETGLVRYTVYHWEQQYDGTYKRFYPSTSDTGFAYTGSSITPVVVSRSERISPASQTVTVEGDGSTFVEYFYDLPVYTLTFDPDPAESGDEVTLTGRYGTMVPEPIFANNGFSASWSPAPSYPYPGYVGFLKDETYIAIWTPVMYNISYNVPSGSLPAGESNPSSYYVYDEFTLVNPTSYPGRDDLRFAGWTGTGLSEPAETVTIHNGSTGNRYYQAIWSLNYKISYNLAGGVLPGSNPSYYNENSDDITLVNPTRNGYIFIGWTGTGLDAPATTVTIPRGSAGDRQYTAQWSSAYTISYDLAGGVMPQGVSNPLQYSSQSRDFTLNNPEKGGYVFTGWTGTNLSEPTLEVTIPKGSTGNRAYTAAWAQLANYTVIHMKQQYQPGNGLSYIQQELEVLSGGERMQTAAAAKIYAGYDVQPFEQETIAPSGATVVYIYYNLKSYTATFDANGGQGGTAQSVIYTLPLTAPASPTRSGYTFTGWDPEIPATMPMEDITFTAQWTPITYSIAYDLADGSVEGSNPTFYNIESPDITLINPTREGYDFAGWTGTGLNDPTVTVTITTGSVGGRTYTATWTPKDGYYTLTFDANGGQGGVEQRYLPGETITPPTVTRTGYTFQNWLIEEDGFRVPYEVTVMPAEDITLYAYWEPISYIIPLHANVGDSGIVVNEIASIECDERGIAWLECWYDELVPLPGYIDTGIGSQYELAGWNTRPDGSGIRFGRTDIVRNLQLDGYGYDLYAQWKLRTEFGVFDAMYTLQRRAFGYDDATGTVTDTIYDASVAADADGIRPVLDYPDGMLPYFRLQRTLDADNPISLYLYMCPDYNYGDDFAGYPLVPYDPLEPGFGNYSYSAPEGSLIGSGNNDGLTQACKTSMQRNPVSFGRDWTKGLVTVGNITKLLADNNGNPGFVFTSVNGVSYFFSGIKLYEYGMDYHYENESLAFTVTNAAPAMADIEAIADYLPGPDPRMG